MLALNYPRFGGHGEIVCADFLVAHMSFCKALEHPSCAIYERQLSTNENEVTQRSARRNIGKPE